MWLGCVTIVAIFLLVAAVARAQDAAPGPPGSIRGVVVDAEFESPIAGAQVLIVESGAKAATGEGGNYLLSNVPPGRYTIVFSKDGYVRQVKPDVAVSPGRLTELNVALSGDFVEMEEFVVQDILQTGAGSEASLLELRLDDPAFLDSIGSDLIGKSGASDAAGALRLVSGATVQDGKYAVVRGLPDRYVSSQLNGVRLPTADEDKRAVELDQFPSAVIESVQVSKTFTPDQQGDASGGAVDIRLKGIPDEFSLQLKAQIGYNSQATGEDDFLTYKGGGIDFLGRDEDRPIQTENLGGNWDGAVGVTTDDAPIDYKWSLSGGGKHELESGLVVGGFANLFYERDSSYYDNGIDDSYWVVEPGGPMTPQFSRGSPTDGDFRTSLFDVTQSEQSEQWGGLGTLGAEYEGQAIGLTYLYSKTTTDKVTLAEDTRGKEYYFPGYDPDDSMSEGNSEANRLAAPYLRTETLEYTERATQSIQLNGRHEIPLDDVRVTDGFTVKSPVLDWTLSHSLANLDQPDKRQFGSLWLAESFVPGRPPFPNPRIDPALHLPYAPAASFTLGNLQRIFKTIDEESDQVSLNLQVPFEQWSEDEGYLKVGLFGDRLDREFTQETFSNFSDGTDTYQADFDDLWSEVFPTEDHAITESLVDVDYDGEQDITAYYGMIDLPLFSALNLVGGVRFESTDIGIVNTAEEEAVWFPPGSGAPTELNPGDADVDFSQDDVLPSVGFVIKPVDKVTIRTSYSQTVARQTFKELTPIQQQEYLGGPVFIGNPGLEMSALTNYDVRVDYAPYLGSLLSASWFYKHVDDPIEYVQELGTFGFTTAVNYPRGFLTGFELEARQGLGDLWDDLEGLGAGANFTYIESEVRLPDDEAAEFDEPNIDAPLSTRDMTGAPEYLLNLYLTYDLAETNTQFALFYTRQGDTLVSGADASTGYFVPSVYATEFDTLNFSVTQRLLRYLGIQFQAKNLTNPEIEEVYRSKYIGSDVTKTSYTKGIDLTLTLSAEFPF